MKYLYLFINIGSFVIPFLFSFHPKIKFYKRLIPLSLGILIMMLIFISWDIVFTHFEIWGFNESYITGYKFLKLPIEEWMFFICIPYASIFTHYTLVKFYPKLEFSKKTTSVIYFGLLSILLIGVILYYGRWYTGVNFSYAIVLLTLVYRYNFDLLKKFFPTFCVVLIPFFIVNGILTGTGIIDQVVWYDNSHNMGIRIATIPIEDSIYALSMLLTVVWIMEFSEKRKIN